MDWIEGETEVVVCLCVPVRQGDYQSGKEEAPVRKMRRRRNSSRSTSRSKYKRGEGGRDGGGGEGGY